MTRAARLLLTVAGLLLSASVLAQGALRPGVVRLDPPQPVATGPLIEVIEFFYYGCPICYELQPQMSRWISMQAPNYVALRRVPVPASDNWENFARLYFTLEALGQIQRLHWPVYDNFHFDNVQLNDEKVMLDWVARNGVDREKFQATYTSAEVTEKLAAAKAMMKQYDVRGVPTLVVDGKYMSSARLAGGTQQLMKLVDELVRRARNERPATAPAASPTAAPAAPAPKQ